MSEVIIQPHFEDDAMPNGAVLQLRNMRFPTDEPPKSISIGNARTGFFPTLIDMMGVRNTGVGERPLGHSVKVSTMLQSVDKESKPELWNWLQQYRDDFLVIPFHMAKYSTERSKTG